MIDITTFGGIIIGLVVMYVGITGDSPLSMFFNQSAFILVFGGTFVATLINVPLRMFPNLIKAFFKLFFEPKVESMHSAIKRMVKYSEIAMVNGVESLSDTDEFKKESPFIRTGFIMLRDGRSEAFIKEVLESHIKETSSRHRMIADVFITMGSFAPTFGLLGTVIGIIQVLRNVTNPAMVGTSMSVALLTTFYGIVLANFVFVPLSGKLRLRSSIEVKYKQLIIESILAIQQGMLPIMVEQRLKTFLEESKA
ncbi:MAG: MotA/TolQ/ExbB proton channel family protein [Candidatus Margulisbacteria bacterium]|nr:MotA/TolQ/ExbB proton channel family protein [Candidatus Margulisiibacteriota bacterium]